MVSIKRFLERLSAIFQKKSPAAGEAVVCPESVGADPCVCPTDGPPDNTTDVSRETSENADLKELAAPKALEELFDDVVTDDGMPVFSEMQPDAAAEDSECNSGDAEESSTAAEPDEDSGADDIDTLTSSYPADTPVTSAPVDEAVPPSEPVAGCRILVVINQKGGVGKTTTAINLSAALAASGKRVLLVDADPQGNAGSGLGIDRNKLGCCLYDLLIGTLPLAEVLVETMIPGLDVVPATVNLAGAEVELVTIDNREYRLGAALKDTVRDGFETHSYDFIIIDCPPSLGLLTINALAVAGEVIIPVQCEFFALEGLSQLYSTLDLVRKELNPRLTRQHILINMYDGRIKLHQQVRAEIEKFFHADLLRTEIPRSVRLSEAPSFGQPIMEYDKNGWLSDIYRRLAEEVVDFE
ncbi:MAG: AAA family ATPase [bacterium]|nr:AAA family ATPase [bacterium]